MQYLKIANEGHRITKSKIQKLLLKYIGMNLPIPSARKSKMAEL